MISGLLDNMFGDSLTAPAPWPGVVLYYLTGPVPPHREDLRGLRQGHDDTNSWGVRNGDSGATVFALQPNNQRQARGIVSAGGTDFTTDQTRVDWTEAPDIFRAYNLKLNLRYYG